MEYSPVRVRVGMVVCEGGGLVLLLVVWLREGGGAVRAGCAVLVLMLVCSSRPGMEAVRARCWC